MALFVAENTSPSASPESPILASGGGKPLVLVIDPDESTRSILEVVMAREGFDVWSSAAASLGLSLLQGRLPDLIVLESDLGGEDGFSFVAQLRGDERLALIPILLLAKAAEQNVTALADVVGASNVVQKPLYARDVVSLVRLEIAARAEHSVRFEVNALLPRHLLRALLACPRTGRLRLAMNRAEVFFEAGKIVGVNFGAHEPSVDTVVRALALTRGQYEVVLEPVPPSGELAISASEFHQQVMPRLQKWDRARERGLPLESRLIVDFSRLAECLADLPDEVNEVVKLFDGFRTVEDVLAESQLSETITLEVATRLYFQRVLTRAHTRGDNLIVLRPMPALFEPAPAQPDDLMTQLFGPDPGHDALATTRPEDWYVSESSSQSASELESSGGWVSAPVPSTLTHGLAPELAQQLDAFQTSMQVESRSELSKAKRFADAESQEDIDTSLEMALMQIAQAQAAGRADDTPKLPEVLVKARPAEPQRAKSQATTPVPPAREQTVRRVTPLLTPVSRDLEEAFFSDAEPEGAEAVVAPRKRARQVWPFVVGGAVVAAAALIIESQREPSQQVAVPTPVVAEPAPQVALPAPVLPEPAAPAIVEQASPPIELDVSENLAEASKLYEARQYRRAQSVLEQVLTDAPKSVEGWILLAEVKYDARDVAGAKEAAEKVVALDPSNARVQILLATMHFDANEKAQGKAALQKYLELAPEGEHVNEVKALLQRYQNR